MNTKSRRHLLVQSAIAAGALMTPRLFAATEEKGNLKNSPGKPANPSRKILMPIGDATEALDTFYAYYRLPEDGYEVVVAAPEARLYHTVLHEIPPNPDVPWDITQERPGYHLKASVAFRDLNASDYAGMFISGGRAPEYIRYDADLCRVTREIAEAGKPIACLCHGIEIMTAAKCIQGKRVTTVAKCAMDCEQGGAVYLNEPVVLDGKLVTGRGYAENTELLKVFLRLLKAENPTK